MEIGCGAGVHLEETCWAEAPSSKDMSVWMSPWTIYEPYHSEKDEPILYIPLDALAHKECAGLLLLGDRRNPLESSVAPNGTSEVNERNL